MEVGEGKSARAKPVAGQAIGVIVRVRLLCFINCEMLSTLARFSLCDTHTHTHTDTLRSRLSSPHPARTLLPSAFHRPEPPGPAPAC